MDDEPRVLAAALTDYGTIAVSGADARAFLHAQLTNDISGQTAQQARRAGWCSPKGRLLASFLVVPRGEEFLLQVARDLVPVVLKRLRMFVLRSQVALTDASDDWSQYGVWGAGAAHALDALGVSAAQADLEVNSSGELIAVRIAPAHHLLLAGGAQRARIAAALPAGDASDWALEEIRAGLPRVVLATQDLFLPQMVNLELIGGVDFHKGCYPGQEIVARTQYRGQLKRRMVRLRSPQPLQPGQDLYADDGSGQPSGTVVNAAGSEALAVLAIATLEADAAVRAEPGGAVLEILPPTRSG
ncbi:MAG: hypothetical protein A3I63_06490 [Betaproteobacteria bacterium RIFCSPLOWO2_02_FULL_66_14]|nr:MAG: hypothetical protein A3I63_06490 [Betaproteobacteria bacterium RIFCSPLOWO2_02_FULL_66_14]